MEEEFVDIASWKQVKRGGWEPTNWPVMGELAPTGHKAIPAK